MSLRTALRARPAVVPSFAGGPLAFFAGAPLQRQNEQQAGKEGAGKAAESYLSLVACADPAEPSRAHVIDCATGRPFTLEEAPSAAAAGAEKDGHSNKGKKGKKGKDETGGSARKNGEDESMSEPEDDMDLLGQVVDQGDAQGVDGADAFEERGEQVTALCFSQDGTEIIVGVLAGVPLVRRFGVLAAPSSSPDAGLGEQQQLSSQVLPLLSQWRGHIGPICACAGDSSGSLVATAGAGRDQSVRVWQIPAKLPAAQRELALAQGASLSSSGYCTHTFSGHGRGGARVLVFHPDPTKALVFAASNEGEIRAWNLLSKQCVLVKEHYADITGLCFVPSPVKGGGLDMVSVARDRVACVWEVDQSPSLKRTFTVSEVAQGACAFSDATLAVAGENGQLRLFDVAKGAEIPGAFEEENSALVGTSVVGLMQHPSASRSSERTGRGGVFCAINTDSHIVILSKHKKTIREEKLMIGSNDEVIDAKFLEVRGAAAKSSDAASFAPRGPGYIAVATNSNDARVFSLETGACRLIRGHSDVTLCLDTSFDAQLLLTGSKDNDVRLWQARPSGNTQNDLPLWHCEVTASGHTEAVVSVGFSRKTNDWFASASSDRTMKIWRIIPSSKGISLDCTHTVPAHDKEINSMCIAPNDRLIATSSQDKTVKLWQVERTKGKEVRAELSVTLRGHRRGVWSSAFSPVDQVIATASSDKTVRLWRVTDGSCLKTFQGHQTGVLSVGFLSHGMQLFSASADGLQNLWTIKTGELVNTFDGGHDDRVWAVAVPSTSDAQSEQEERRDGAIVKDVVLTAGSDGFILLWDDVTEALVQRERARRDDFVLKEQELDSALQQKQWDKAIRVAFALDQPARLLAICDAALHSGSAERATLTGTEEGEEESAGQLPGRALLRNVVKHKLFRAKLEKALGYIREWNANSRTAHTAQEVLRAILDEYPPDDLAHVPNIQGLLEGLMPYTARHYSRIGALVQQTYLLDFLCDQIRLSAPDRIAEPETDDATAAIADGEAQSDVDAPTGLESSVIELDEDMAAAPEKEPESGSNRKSENAKARKGERRAEQASRKSSKRKSAKVEKKSSKSKRPAKRHRAGSKS